MARPVYARLADLLERRGDLDGAAQVLRTRADAGDRGAARRLADLAREARRSGRRIAARLL